MYAPHETDALLTELYGDDYLVPPSEEVRDTHAYLEFDLSTLGGLDSEAGR